MGIGKYPWLIGKLIALAFIFIGGGLLAVLIIAASWIAPINKAARTRIYIRRIFYGYLQMLQFLRMLDLTVAAKAELAASGGRIIIANHPCLLDIVALIAFVPKAQCIVKAKLWHHWFLGQLMRTAGYIRNDLPPEQLIAACKQSLDAKDSLIIFPEGTRTIPGRPVQFMRGFANIATMVDAPILAIVINFTPIVLYKGEPWWRIPPRKPQMSLSAGTCLDARFYTRFPQRSIACRRVVEYLQTYYRENAVDG